MSVQDGPEMHLNARPKILVPVLLLLAIGGAFGAWKAGLLKSFTTGGSGKTSSAYFEDSTAEVLGVTSRTVTRDWLSSATGSPDPTAGRLKPACAARQHREQGRQ